jgi:hypothetical protein
MVASGAAESFFVVASTDLLRSGVMTTRIREQLERVAEVKGKSKITITTLPVELPPAKLEETLEQQIQTVADCVTEMILASRERKQLHAGKVARETKSKKSTNSKEN